ncbi:MAG: LuxR C-terminal-related transcriptional regulator [Chloroflexi bacterium]|nr:LuxR C-terminal-related transcriptional regulator [Chloroflexota bacterium]
MQTKQLNGATQLRAEPSSPPLLATKLHIPQARPDLTARQRLLEQLNRGLSSKLTLISAPAGFGKTTLVSQWIHQNAALDAELHTPVAWFTLDAGDNDPMRFWRYVITACQAFDAAIGHAALALLHTAQPPAWETVLTLLINDLAQLNGKAVLVLEDYHVIGAPQIHELMIFLLDYLPATVHLIMTTRADPPLPLARWRARPDLTELRIDDLRFSLAETQDFFQHTLACPLAPELIERMEMRTEGWVTGLRLIALTLQGRVQNDAQAMEQLLTTFSSSHGHIFAYLIAEVLNAQPAPVQDFLLYTCLLNRFTAALCDAVTGRTDSAIMLEELRQANLFLLPLDEGGPAPQQPSSLKHGPLHTVQWQRYHALFAEALIHEARRRLGEATLRTLMGRASRWYAAQDLLTEAVEAALTAQEFPLIAELIERVIAPELVQNEYHTLRRWLEQLPEAVLHAHPTLCMAYATAILFTSDRRAPTTMTLIQAPLHVAEAHWRSTDNQPKLGEALAFRAWVTSMQGARTQAGALAQQALGLLPASETQWRGISLALVGEALLLAGQLQAAHATFNQTYALWQTTTNKYGLLATLLGLADICSKQGQLQEAAQFYRQVISAVEKAPMNPHQARMRIGGAQLGLAALALEWNDLATAEQAATEAVEIGQQIAYEDFRIRGTLILAQIKQAHGETAAAQQIVQPLFTQTPQRQTLPLLREARLWQARLALTAGDWAAVERFITSLQPEPDVARLQQEQETLLIARLHLAQGKPAETLSLLQPWCEEAHNQGRIRSELAIKMLQSLAYFAGQEIDQAKTRLIQALAQAQGEGYQRLFLDEGEPMNELLRLIWPTVKTEPLAAYVRALLLAFAQAQPEAMRPQANSALLSAPAVAFLVEPLSTQEQRVLQLLTVSHSNAEIAKELIVSVNTIKTQVQSIYRKLNVNSRQEACAAAQHLKLV